MKKGLLYLAGIFIAGAMNAQNCIPDYNPSATILGFDPNPINGSVEGVPYDEVVTIVLPRQVDNTLTPAPGDSIPLCEVQILSITGVPSGYNYEVWATTLGSGTAYNVLDLAIDTIPIHPTNPLTRACLRLTNSNPPGPTIDPLIDSIPIQVIIAAWSNLGFGCVSLEGVGGTDTFLVKLPIKDAVFASVEDEMNNEIFAVYANYPNPANQQTTLSFTTPTVAPVQVTIVDALGRQVFVSTFTSKQGLNTLPVSTQNLRSGVYMYTIYYNNKAITKKLIVNK
ncbi:MAG: T9SS type A sorting domain-containing protein [Flavobacteriales bacterium]|nr:T9SS type A sorting domain-containing protein [Flavobacteriales bacterium]